MSIIKSIAYGLGFSSGVATAATVVVADKATKAAKNSYKATTSYDYKALADSTAQGFTNGKSKVYNRVISNKDAVLLVEHKNYDMEDL